jgi:hypothetical protein
MDIIRFCKFCWTVIFIVSCLFILFPAGPASAQPEYVGEVCIEFVDGTYPLRLHVVGYGTDTFQLTARMQTTAKHFTPVHGAAVLEEGHMLKMTLSGSESGSQFTDTFLIDLSDPSNIGTVTSLSTTLSYFFLPGAPDYLTRTSSWSFRFIQCP